MKKVWLVRNIYHTLNRWYSGYDVRVDPDKPDTGAGGLGVLHETKKEFHWTAKLARSVWEFSSGNWINRLTLFFTAMIAIATIGIWLFPVKQDHPEPIPPVLLNQDYAGQKTPPPSTEPHKEFSEHNNESIEM